KRIENHRVLLAEIPAVVDALGALKPLPVDSGQVQLPGAGTWFVLESRNPVTFKELSHSSAQHKLLLGPCSADRGNLRRVPLSSQLDGRNDPAAKWTALEIAPRTRESEEDVPVMFKIPRMYEIVVVFRQTLGGYLHINVLEETRLPSLRHAKELVQPCNHFGL